MMKLIGKTLALLAVVVLILPANVWAEKKPVGRIIAIIGSAEYLPGDEVEIIAGQLTGLKGKLLKIEREKNFLVELDRLGFQIRMQVDPSLLHRIGRNPNWKADESKNGLWNKS